ncbi:MAG TPA: hypothetical protein ENG63_07495 [Candidatus Desulfofervidus auxilii]|uniref:Uncharacterized protein n=1 Tax=Desulfofervidus auxilii TaxID=1621989 RepID=A0A7C0Y3E1_DESA2|nr:hypothetical protein [Candidatus Desulfofervidus auxilii]
MDAEDIIALVFHKAWINWSKTIARKKILNEKELEKWKKLWVSFDKLGEKQKEKYRKFAKEIINLLAENKYIITFIDK